MIEWFYPWGLLPYHWLICQLFRCQWNNPERYGWSWQLPKHHKDAWTMGSTWHFGVEDVIHPMAVTRVINNSLRPRLNRRPFADDIFKCIFLNEDEWILPRISLKFVPKVRINNIPALVQIMAWRRPGDKPLSEPTKVNSLTHICVTRPQWGKHYLHGHLL